jgi:methyl-accepting chemotaxis protein
MRLQAQLMLISLAGVATAVVIGGLAYRSGESTVAHYELAMEEMQAVRFQMDGDMMHDAIHSDLILWTSAKDENEQAEARNDFKIHAERMRDAYEAVDRLSTIPESESEITDGRKVVEEYLSAAEALLATAPGEGRDHAREAFDASFEHAEEVLGKLSDSLQLGATRCAEESAAAAQSARNFGLGIGLAMVTVVMGGTMWLSGRISKRMNESLSAVLLLGQGDLTHRVHDSGNDEIGIFANEFNRACENLKKVVGEVSASAREVSGSSNEIAAASEQMAAGITKQREQAGQVAAAVEEMAGSVAEVAKKAGDAADSSRSAQKEADRGGDVVSQTVQEINAIAEDVNRSSQAVSSLGKKSEQIGAIIEVINDIADQTNLLALNAAIEAARAGEHGRGFAVVADEVRKLAERTQQATEEVSRSIREIQDETRGAVERIEAGAKRVVHGVELANSAGQALSSIVGSGKMVQEMVESIAAASEEQSSASEQIARNVEQISAVAVENSQGAEQAARAAAELAAQARKLQSLIGTFKL